MDSSSNNSYHHHSNQPSSAGLLRFRSAPSTLRADFNDSGVTNGSLLNFQELEDKSSVERIRNGAGAYPNSPVGFLGLPPHYPRQSVGIDSGGSYGLIGSMTLGHHEQDKAIDSSSLARQNSSPAGLFGNYNIGANVEAASTTRLKSQLSFPSRVPSSLNMLSQISEVANESPYSSWGDSPFAESFSPMKAEQESNAKLFPTNQNGDLGTRVPMLSHHLSLPKTSSEMVALEKFLNLQDSVPCKIRAKRGCATHPRSIAERVRRTRISERMRKLQDLVPNMEKQTNTADMLDLAVEYIKDLQRQYKILSENRANCKCSSKQKPMQNQII